MRVLEISRGAAAGYAGLLLAELGFDVHRVAVAEAAPLEGDAAEARRLFLHRGKQPLAGPPADAVAGFDAVIEDVGRAELRKLGLSHRSIKRSRPDMVLVSVSPFGLSGPYRGWAGHDIHAQAVGGVMHVVGYDGEAPRKLPGDSAATIAGLHAATAAVTAVFGAKRGVETGVHIDISAQDTLMQHWTRHISQYAYTGTLMRREPRRPRGIQVRHTARARDGWLYMLALRTPWQAIARFLGLERFVAGAYADSDVRNQPWDAMEGPFHDALAQKDRYDWFTEAAAQRWTFAPVEEPARVLHGPQSEARGSYATVEYRGRTLRVPGLPYRVTAGSED